LLSSANQTLVITPPARLDMPQPGRIHRETGADTSCPLDQLAADPLQALIIAKQHADRYGDLIKAISGVILLGCPHGARQLDNLRESVSLILRSAGCDSRKVLAPLEESVDVLQEVALQFDPNTIPYLVSVYEEKSTFLDRNGLFGRAQHVVVSCLGPLQSNIVDSAQLVNKRLTMINGTQHQFSTGLANSHWNLTALSDMSGWKDGRISQLMEMVLKHALGSHSRELTSSCKQQGLKSLPIEITLH